MRSVTWVGASPVADANNIHCCVDITPWLSRLKSVTFKLSLIR